jgi:hypothetical protein
MIKLYLIIFICFNMSNLLLSQRSKIDTSFVIMLDELPTNDSVSIDVLVPDSMCRNGSFRIPIEFKIEDAGAVYYIENQIFANGLGFFQEYNYHEEEKKYSGVILTTEFHLETSYWYIIIPKMYCDLLPDCPEKKWDIYLSFNVENRNTGEIDYYKDKVIEVHLKRKKQ